MKTPTRPPGPVVTIGDQEVQLTPAHLLWDRTDLIVETHDGSYLLVVHGRAAPTLTHPPCPQVIAGWPVQPVAIVHVARASVGTVTIEQGTP